MRTNDGQELRGAVPAEVVLELREISMEPTATVHEFMAQTAARALRQTGQRVRCDTAENFVCDLLTAGLLLED